MFSRVLRTGLHHPLNVQRLARASLGAPRYFSRVVFSEEHEWVSQANAGDSNVTIGITDHAQSELGDIVYIELPNVGDSVTKGEAFGSVESVKAANDLFAPVTGEVTEVNATLADAPETVNKSPEETGWMIKVDIKHPNELEELMEKDAYVKFVKQE